MSLDQFDKRPLEPIQVTGGNQVATNFSYTTVKITNQNGYYGTQDNRSKGNI